MRLPWSAPASGTSLPVAPEHFERFTLVAQRLLESYRSRICKVIFSYYHLGEHLPMTSAHELDWLAADIEHNQEKINILIQHYGSRLLNEVKADIENSLASLNPATRFMAAVRMQMHLTYGVDTKSACALGDTLLQQLKTHWESLSSALQPNPVVVLAIVLSSWIYASKQEGHWSNLLHHWLSWGALVPKLREEQHYWNSGCHIAITLLRSNELKAVEDFINTFPKHLQPFTPQLGVLRDQLAEFSHGRFELDTKPTTDKAARMIWEHNLEANAETLSQLYEKSKTQPVATLGWDVSKLPMLVAELKSQHDFALSNIPFDEKYRSLSRRAYEWRNALRDFLSPGRDPQHVNNEWIEDCLTRIALIQADAIESNELTNTAVIALKDIGKSLRWARRAGDLHSAWMLRWCASTVYEKLERPARRLRALHRLSASLHSKRLGTKDPNLCSLVAHYFSGFAEKVTKSRDSLSRPTLMMDVFELRRGRALIAARADLEISHYSEQNQPPTLGTRTHYLGYTVFYERQEVFAQLLSADGVTSIHTIAIDWNELLKASLRLDPSRWNKHSRFEHSKQPLWVSLAALLSPIDIAIKKERVAVGDHICISAEDPIHLIPLHALPCNGKPMFWSFSVSRVASYSDAMRLALEKFNRPTHATALFIDAQHKDPAWRRAHFRQTVETLRSLHLFVEEASPEWMTADELLPRLTHNRIIHLHAHGHFPPNLNPQTNSGIIVSDGSGPPRLDGNASCTLTPNDILASNPQMTGSHITLSTCVSGKGLPGKYGDALGLEMALRWSGASSLLATHWDVRSDDAMIFCEHFYHEWLAMGNSRARAWQLAIQALADPDAPIDNQARWCAFSLFGGWT